MSLVYAFLAEGFEEIEALTVVDILRRADIDIKTVSISDKYEVTGAHKIEVKADILFEEADFERADVLFLPGGIPGTPNLEAHEGLRKKIIEFHHKGKRLTAICAAPSIYGGLGILDGKKATCYPGYEEKLTGAACDGAKVVTDGNITTAKGMGVAIEFGLELVALLEGKEKADEIAEKIQFSR